MHIESKRGKKSQFDVRDKQIHDVSSICERFLVLIIRVNVILQIVDEANRDRVVVVAHNESPA